MDKALDAFLEVEPQWNPAVKTGSTAREICCF